MPNWVPQSPTWFWRITVSPRNSSTRATASPMMVERRWPTCISLARLGADRSTTTRCAGPALRTAECGVGQCGFEALGQGVAVLEEVEEAGAGDFHLADAGVGGQGGDQFLGQVARLHARPAWPASGRCCWRSRRGSSSLAFSTWIAGVSPSGSTPSAVRRVRACWIRWRMVSFMVCSVGRGWSKTAHYTKQLPSSGRP